MRAVIVYESMYGNTHQVAEAIGAGLEPACEVSIVPVSQATQESLAGADLVVVGGPTHVHGMSRPPAASRRSRPRASRAVAWNWTRTRQARACGSGSTRSAATGPRRPRSIRGCPGPPR